MTKMIPLKDQATIYTLLGRVFIGELNQECLEAFKNPDILSVFEKLHFGFRDYVKNTTWDEDYIEQLASDYCHLFVLPRNSGLSLRVSCWISNNEPLNMAQLEILIKDLEFDLSTLTSTFLNIPTDHLGILLYFISAIYSSDDPDIQKLGSQLVKFTLVPWIPRFVEKLLASTTNPIYLASGKLLSELLEYEMSVSS